MSGIVARGGRARRRRRGSRRTASRPRTARSSCAGVLKSNGRGSIFIQSTPVTRADLQEFSSLLFDVHGQHEHQSLLDVENHRRLVDR